ncbi:hypothetical protein ACIGEP_06130 [Microbacterium sp. NPDC077663]|uniref:hypothetical protein n=1 Tax=Microbacterium sp. NPDC077663 TaxID=3364189 RepID=UPI0037C9E524
MTGHYRPDEPSIMGLHDLPAPRPAARTASPGGVFRPEYGETTLAGTAVALTLGARRFNLPEGTRIGIPEDGHGRVLLVLDGDTLHALTAAGEITNMPQTAASALGDDVFGRPDVRPPP